MENTNLYFSVVGVLMLIAAAAISSYFLLCKKIDVKRVLVFTVILSFCGAFFLLYERITVLEVVGLGKIRVQAFEDAAEIRIALQNAKMQRDEIERIVEDANTLKERIDFLSENLEKEKINTDRKIIISRLQGELDRLRERGVELKKEITQSMFQGGNPAKLINEEYYLRSEIAEKEKSLQEFKNLE